MSDPAATLSTVLVAALAALATIPGLDASIVLGSFAGAVVFVLGADDIGPLKKSGYLIVSLIGGLLLAPLAAAFLSALSFEKIAVPMGVGALVAATIIVKLLRWLLKQDLGELLKLIRGTRQ